MSLGGKKPLSQRYGLHLVPWINPPPLAMHHLVSDYFLQSTPKDAVRPCRPSDEVLIGFIFDNVVLFSHILQIYVSIISGRLQDFRSLTAGRYL